MKRSSILLVLTLMLIVPTQAKKAKTAEQTDRQYWCTLAYRY